MASIIGRLLGQDLMHSEHALQAAAISDSSPISNFLLSPRFFLTAIAVFVAISPTFFGSMTRAPGALPDTRSFTTDSTGSWVLSGRPKQLFSLVANTGTPMAFA